jgi:hypothetical protein
MWLFCEYASHYPIVPIQHPGEEHETAVHSTLGPIQARQLNQSRSPAAICKGQGCNYADGLLPRVPSHNHEAQCGAHGDTK